MVIFSFCIDASLAKREKDNDLTRYIFAALRVKRRQVHIDKNRNKN
jgi:hypothetical protein